MFQIDSHLTPQCRDIVCHSHMCAHTYTDLRHVIYIHTHMRRESHDYIRVISRDKYKSRDYNELCDVVINSHVVKTCHVMFFVHIASLRMCTRTPFISYVYKWIHCSTPLPSLCTKNKYTHICTWWYYFFINIARFFIAQVDWKPLFHAQYRVAFISFVYTHSFHIYTVCHFLFFHDIKKNIFLGQCVNDFLACIIFIALTLGGNDTKRNVEVVGQQMFVRDNTME